MSAPLRAAGGLMLAAALAAGLTSLVAALTAEDIERVRAGRERAALEAALPELRGLDWPRHMHGVDLAGGARRLQLTGRDGQRLTVLSPWPATGGYNGRIDLLVAFGDDGRLRRVRVLRHRETPGIGDRVLAADGDWLQRFEGLPVSRGAGTGEALDIDAVSGATVTTRAVRQAVQAALDHVAGVHAGGQRP